MRSHRLHLRRPTVAAAVVFASVAITLWAMFAATSVAGAAPRFVARGSAEQAYATGLVAHARVRLVDAAGRTVQTARADAQGGILFRDVSPAAGYRIVVATTRSGPLRVYTDRSAPLSTALYHQKIHAGYGYLTTRDGTQLAIDVHLPKATDATSLLGGSGLPENASIVRPTKPYPTLIEYAGYGYANPAGPVNGIAQLANLLGFAVVDVSMRGTGCSGGAYDYFEPNQSLDGYDVIETIAHQSWVLDHKVGMLGISYGGISQLFTAAEDPPALEAIAPLSPIDSTITTLYPGGDLNTGFAYSWAVQRVDDAKPFSTTADQAYALKRITQGDATCRANQALHGEAYNLIRKIHDNQYYVPKVADALDPIAFVHKIHAATFMACQFTDEQVGAHCPDLAEHFTGTRRKWFTFTNGTHIDSLDPETLTRMFDFYELYVAHRRPVLDVDLGPGKSAQLGLASELGVIGPPLLKITMGIDNAQLNGVPADAVEAEPTYASALAAFDKTPEVTVGFDNGAAAGNAPGIPLPAFTATAPRFPFPGTVARSWYFAPGGVLAPSAGASGSDAFTYSAKQGTVTDYHGNTGAGGLWNTLPSYDWTSPTAGQAVSFVTAPLQSNTVVVGAGTASLWVKSTKPAVDLQATITEVRPDGKEVYVQNGYLRGDESRLTPHSTSLQASQTLRRSQLIPLEPGHWTHITVPLYYEGHAYRAGSRIRVIIGSIGGNQPIWSFAQPGAKGIAKVTVGYSATMDSRLTLPVVPSISVPTALPANCNALRGEPCRTYAPFVNRGS
jgi:predicted acyl esterase